MRKFYMAGAAGVALALAYGQAGAQTAPDNKAKAEAQHAAAKPAVPPTVTEVVVTARKRAEKLFDVPGPVTAVTGQQIDNVRFNDARELMTLIPTGFLQEINAGTARDINIRGIGTPTLFAEPGVASYVDGVYSSGFISYPTQFYDLDRVEVLRGPQGALYGRNAVGGAVDFLSHEPTPDLGGYLRASYGNWDRYEIEGMANVPINDQSGLRLVGWRTDQQTGEYYNETLHQWIDKNDSLGGRAVYHANITDKLSVNLIAEAQKGDTPGTNLYFPQAGETMTTIQRDTEPTNKFASDRLAAEVNWDTDLGRFTGVAGYRNYVLTGVEDTDLTAIAADKEVTDRKNSVVSRYAELRWLSRDLGPVSLLAGITYLDDHGIGDVFTDLAGDTAAFGVPVNLAIHNDQSVTSWSPYIEATWHLTKTLSLIGDLRYTDDRKTENFLFTPSPALSFAVPSYVGQGLVTTKDFTRTSPGATLAWSPDDDWRVYGKVQTGFRAGGFNFNVGSINDLAYNSETSINYEVGVKRRIPGGYVAATAFDLQQDNVLTPEYDLTAPGPLGSYLGNLGKARTYGLELEANLHPIPGLTLNANVGLLDAEFTSGTAAFSGSLAGKELPAARKFTGAIVADYRHTLVGDTDWLFNAAYTHRSGGWGDAPNTFRYDGLDQLNMTAGVDLHRRLKILAYVQNALNDQNIIAFGGYEDGGYGILRAPGTSYGIELKQQF
jgi:iron complex outermembrane receptor protein